ncbi:MAG TPA: type II secretion system protein [Steroidobacteraceae bacterium]
MPRLARGASGPAGAAGFTYIGLLIAVAILGIGLSAVGTIWRTQAQREREQELLFIGREFRTAIAAYYRAGGHQFPQDLNDLLEDKRGTEPRHYLRKLYADPMTGAQDWTLLTSGVLGITGIASSSKAEPLKKKGFPLEEAAFEDASCYCDWKFEYVPRILGRRTTQVAPSAD